MGRGDILPRLSVAHNVKNWVNEFLDNVTSGSTFSAQDVWHWIKRQKGPELKLSDVWDELSKRCVIRFSKFEKK